MDQEIPENSSKDSFQNERFLDLSNWAGNKMVSSKQYISKILKGQENLSLETISKIEDSLGLPLLIL